MRRVIVIIAALVLSGCAGSQGSNEYYTAANQPLMEISLPSPTNGEPYKIMVRRQNIQQYEHPVIGAIKAVGGIINGPTGVLGGVAAVLNNSRGDTTGSNNETTTNTTETTEVIQPTED